MFSDGQRKLGESVDTIQKNLVILEDKIGCQLVGVERLDGKLLVMFSDGQSMSMVEIDRYAIIKEIS
jgi:hypothetical protein